MLGDKNFNKKIIQFININFKNQKKVFHLKANPKQSNSAANKHEIKDLLSKSQMSLCVIINLLKVLFEINPNLINTEMIEDSLLVIRYLLMMSKDLYKKYIQKNKKVRGQEEKVSDIELDYNIDHCYSIKINYVYLRQYTLYLINIITERKELLKPERCTLLQFYFNHLLRVEDPVIKY